MKTTWSGNNTRQSRGISKVAFSICCFLVTTFMYALIQPPQSQSLSLSLPLLLSWSLDLSPTRSQSLSFLLVSFLPSSVVVYCYQIVLELVYFGVVEAILHSQLVREAFVWVISGWKVSLASIRLSRVLLASIGSIRLIVIIVVLLSFVVCYS